ncbi:MAG: hypothetical protein V3W37_03140 [Candidatus Binatia bacterium]
MPDPDKEHETPKALKEGEIAVKKEDWDRIKAKASQMDGFKADVKRLKEEDLHDLQEEVERLKEAQKAKEGEGTPDVTAAVEKAVGEVKRDLDKAHAKALGAQEQKLTVEHAAQIALAEANVKPVLWPSVDLKDVTDSETAKERVKAFVEANPEVVKKEAQPDPGTPPVNTGPAAGGHPPGSPEPKGPKTPEERHAIMATHFKATRDNKAGSVGQGSG